MSFFFRYYSIISFHSNCFLKNPLYCRLVNALKTFVELNDICSLNLALVSHRTISPRKSKLVSVPVLAGLAGDHLVDVLHILVDLDLVGGEGAEQQLVAGLRLQAGGQADHRHVIDLVGRLLSLPPSCKQSPSCHTKKGEEKKIALSIRIKPLDLEAMDS